MTNLTVKFLPNLSLGPNFNAFSGRVVDLFNFLKWFFLPVGL